MHWKLTWNIVFIYFLWLHESIHTFSLIMFVTSLQPSYFNFFSICFYLLIFSISSQPLPPLPNPEIHSCAPLCFLFVIFLQKLPPPISCHLLVFIWEQHIPSPSILFLFLLIPFPNPSHPTPLSSSSFCCPVVFQVGLPNCLPLCIILRDEVRNLCLFLFAILFLFCLSAPSLLSLSACLSLALFSYVKVTIVF